MFLKLFSIEWTRLTRRVLFWFTLVICPLYIGLSLSHFYSSNQTELLTGELKMPGVSFDLANALDQLLIAIPFLVIIAGSIMGSDYSQRTNQHWLRHASRTSSLLSKFAMLVLLTLIIQVITLLTGYLTGAYYKTVVYDAPNLFNINWLATLAAPFYMTLVNLPYLALTLLLTVLVRSSFFSVVVGLGYTQFIEFLLAGFLHGASWTKWLFTNIHFSASFLLNSIGNRAVEIPEHILAPSSALIVAAIYTLGLLCLASWLYRCQDVGG